MPAKPIKCAWCGGTFPPTKKGRPKQHLNGATTCPGSGQQRPTHEGIIARFPTPPPKR